MANLMRRLKGEQDIDLTEVTDPVQIAKIRQHETNA
jgi:hypothetical protein